MTKKLHSKRLILMIAIFVMLFQSSCSLFSSQTNLKDPEHVDNSAEQTDIPEAQVPIEEMDEAEEAESHFEESYFEQDGIKLYYDPQLILDVQPPSESIPASSGDEMYDMPHPTYVHFNLYMEQAQVYIVPVQEYETAANFAPDIIADLHRISDNINTFSDCVPELPLSSFFHVCEHQQFNSNLAQVDFQNGSGVRFVSVYGVQDMVPVENEHLVYVFQGFTNDGKYYIKAFVRLFHSQLPETGELPADVYTAADANIVQQYFDGFEQMLDQNEADFSPALDWIDTFLGSLRVE